MATTKPTFAKLKLQKNIAVKTIKFNEIEIEVKQYLPIEDKLALIANVINKSADENNFANPAKQDLYGTLEIIYYYTNLSFTEKQKEDPGNLYDIMMSSGFADAVIAAIPSEEYSVLVKTITDCANAVYSYKNSVIGLLETVNQDYSNLDMDATAIQKKLNDPDNMALLRNVLTKLG